MVGVTPINTATNTPGKPITVGAQPWQIAITPNGKTVYVASATMHTGMVTPINTATNTAGKPIILKRAGPLAIGPTLSATSP